MISITVTGDNAPACAAELLSFAQILSPTHMSNTLLTQGEVDRRFFIPATDNPPEASALGESASPPKAPVKRSARAQKAAAAAAEADPLAIPAAMQRTDFIVFDGTGAQKAGYAHAKDAAKVLLAVLGGLTDPEQVDLFSSSNEATLQRFDDAMREPIDAAIIAKLESLGVDASVDNGDGNNPAEVTKEDVRAAIKLLLSEKGQGSAQAVMTALGAATLADIKPTDYAKALGILNAARKGEPPNPAEPTKKNLFDG